MIDSSLAMPPWVATLFHLKQIFWMYAWPVLAGFLTITAYQALGRISMMGTAKWPVVFTLGTAASMISLYGWLMMVRWPGMIPLYGMGVGAASVLMSRIYAVAGHKHRWLPIRTLRIVWRGDAAGIAAIHRMTGAGSGK